MEGGRNGEVDGGVVENGTYPPASRQSFPDCINPRRCATQHKNGVERVDG